MRFHASDMIMNIHSDASYHSKKEREVTLADFFFMGWMPKDKKSIKLNGTFHTNSGIMRFIIASAAEAELGALFHNCQTGKVFLTNISQPWPPTTKNSCTLR